MRFFLWIPFYSGLIGITILSVIPLQELQIPNIVNIDKAGHALVYFALCCLLYVPLKTKKISFQRGSLLVLLYSGILELVQHYFIENRFGDFVDFLSNAIGIGLAVLLISRRIKT